MVQTLVFLSASCGCSQLRWAWRQAGLTAGFWGRYFDNKPGRVHLLWGKRHCIFSRLKLTSPPQKQTHLWAPCGTHWEKGWVWSSHILRYPHSVPLSAGLRPCGQLHGGAVQGEQSREGAHLKKGGNGCVSCGCRVFEGAFWVKVGGCCHFKRTAWSSEHSLVLCGNKHTQVLCGPHCFLFLGTS